jgi:hypothetical protein
VVDESNVKAVDVTVICLSGRVESIHLIPVIELTRQLPSPDFSKSFSTLHLVCLILYPILASRATCHSHIFCDLLLG